MLVKSSRPWIVFNTSSRPRGHCCRRFLYIPVRCNRWSGLVLLGGHLVEALSSGSKWSGTESD